MIGCLTIFLCLFLFDFSWIGRGGVWRAADCVNCGKVWLKKGKSIKTA
jgi:hypothetical protein